MTYTDLEIDKETVEVGFNYEPYDAGDGFTPPHGGFYMVEEVKINGVDCSEILKLNHIREHFETLIENHYKELATC